MGYSWINIKVEVHNCMNWPWVHIYEPTCPTPHIHNVIHQRHYLASFCGPIPSFKFKIRLILGMMYIASSPGLPDFSVLHTENGGGLEDEARNEAGIDMILL